MKFQGLADMGFFKPDMQVASLLFSTYTRLRWSRGRVLAFGTQVHGFKPGRSRWIFQGEKKILSTPSFGRESKAVCPMS